MPSSATITSFYTFTANTRARATQVNGNFSVFRGHLLPIDPNTATAISNTYDLGSTEYYWRTVYGKTFNVMGAATTSAATIAVDTATGQLVFSLGGTERFRISTVGAATNTVSTVAVQDQAITTAKVGDQAITTGKLFDLNVTTAKIADDNITSGKILDSAVITSKIANNNITRAKVTTSAYPYNGLVAFGQQAGTCTGAGPLTLLSLSYTGNGSDEMYAFVQGHFDSPGPTPARVLFGGVTTTTIVAGVLPLNTGGSSFTGFCYFAKVDGLKTNYTITLQVNTSPAANYDVSMMIFNKNPF